MLTELVCRGRSRVLLGAVSRRGCTVTPVSISNRSTVGPSAPRNETWIVLLVELTRVQPGLEALKCSDRTVSNLDGADGHVRNLHVSPEFPRHVVARR